MDSAKITSKDIGLLIYKLPDMTAILLEPCSSHAILSASSISSIPKPCQQINLLFEYNSNLAGNISAINSSKYNS